MKKKGQVGAKIKNSILSIKHYWNTPAEGKYVPYKELAAYSVGGAGVYFIISIAGMIMLNAGSMIVGASIGLKAVDLQTLNVISTLVILALTPLRAMAFDNTKSKMGKFRPYILTMGLPTAFLSTLFVYLPYETMTYDKKLVAVGIIFTLLQFFNPFYLAAYSGLVQVMSPNSKERAWIIEVSSIIYSAAPTIVNPVIPLIGPMDNLKTYRIAFPIFCTIGLAISMLAVFGTKEKVIVPKTYVQKMGFFEGLKKVMRNKYFWIINFSGWMSFLTMGYNYLFQWVFYYGMQNKYIYSILVILKGEGSTPGMLLGAPLTNKMGKRNISLMAMSMQIICLIAMFFCYKNFIAFFIFMFIKDIFSAMAIIYLPSMKADMMDYQQYKTGDRLEGFIEQIGGMIGGILTLATGYVIPFILKHLGLTDNYNDLYNADFRNPIVKAMLICCIIGSLLSIIPFFFYDLSEEKRSGMITALKIRALFEDFSHGEMEEEKIKSVLDEIHVLEATLQEETGHDKKSKEKLAGAKIALEELEKQKAKYPDAFAKMESICQGVTV